MNSIFLFVWNPNFPVGNNCRWLSSSQNISLVRDSGLTISLAVIEINSFSHDLFTKTVPFAPHLYVYRRVSLNSMFDLLSIILEFALMFLVTSNTNTLIYCKMKWIRNVWDPVTGDISFCQIFFYIYWKTVLGIIIILKQNWDG